MKFVLLLAASAGLLLAVSCTSVGPPPREVCATCRIVCGQCEGEDRFVRLQGNANAHFSHPATLSPKEWETILSSIQVQNQGMGFLSPRGSVEEAFTPDEVEYLSRFLSQAFAQARPTEWIVFGLRHAQTPLVDEITTGGWYLEGPTLHLILANYRVAVSMANIRSLMWENPLLSQVVSYDLVPGPHQTAAHSPILGVPLQRPQAPELAIAYRPLLLGEPEPQPPTRKSRALARPKPAPPAPMSFEQRLKALKQLRDQGLLTEEEYQAKRRQMLEQF